MLCFAFVYVFLFIPETKGISLEEVDELYRSGVKAWHSSTWKPSGERDIKRAQGMAPRRRASDETVVNEPKHEGQVSHHEGAGQKKGVCPVCMTGTGLTMQFLPCSSEA